MARPCHPRPLTHLGGQRLGEYETELGSKPLRYRQGWTHFTVSLRDREGRRSSRQIEDGTYVRTSVLEGIHSRGGRWVKGWIEIGDFFPVVDVLGPGLPAKSVRLSDQGMDRNLFDLLSATVPPGGHLMFAYEVSHESSLHRETAQALTKGVPPACTIQGDLLFHAGCRWIKDWYLAEGGHEGPRKLWGEKPSDETAFRQFDSKTFWQVLAFLSRKPAAESIGLEHAARARALKIMQQLRLEDPLSDIQAGLFSIIRGGSGGRTRGRETASICRYLKRFRETTRMADEIWALRLEEIVTACSRRD